MLITNFNTISPFNYFWNDAIPNLQRCKPLTAELYVLWKFNRLDIIKAYAENEVSVSNYVEVISGSHKDEYIRVVDFYNNNYANKELYVYPYSSTKFSNAMLKNILPSAQDKLYDVIFTNSSFIYEKYEPSSSSFKACILAKYNPTAEELSRINDLVFAEQLYDYAYSLGKTLEHMGNLESNNKALKEYIIELESTILNLNSQLDLIQKEGINGYLLNWH